MQKLAIRRKRKFESNHETVSGKLSAFTFESSFFENPGKIPEQFELH